MKIILGSASKQRKRMLERMGYEFEVMTADINEKAIRYDDPKKLTMALAIAKAEALLPRIKESALLITADQVVWWNGKILEKPEMPEEARQFLRGYAHYPAQPINATVVTNTETGKQVAENDGNAVYFKEFPEEVIKQLIAEGNIFTQAGAFSLEDPLIEPYIERIEGSLESIEGLPVELTQRLIKKAQA
ncbi:MAG: Maf family protein [Candidatus Yanofskybacteria bacterium]|nr:Maf family protein [Candidatus Yanofskybacteria bacterium]